MIVLDTTVLVYAKGVVHPLRDPCRELVAAVAEGAVEATTTVEVLQEFAHVRARRRGAAEAASLTRSFGQLLAPLLTVDAEQLDRGLELFERHERLGSFDAVLVAAALDAGARALVSADLAFAGVEGLSHTVPDAAGVSALLER